MAVVSSLFARRAVSFAHHLLQIRRMKSAWQRLSRFAGYGKESQADKGPLVSVVKFHGVLRRPRAQVPSRGDSSLYFDKHRKFVDAAFDAKDTRAVALDINCPGALSA
jgi:ClpP class serine protease